MEASAPFEIIKAPWGPSIAFGSSPAVLAAGQDSRTSSGIVLSFVRSFVRGSWLVARGPASMVYQEGRARERTEGTQETHAQWLKSKRKWLRGECGVHLELLLHSHLHLLLHKLLLLLFCNLRLDPLLVCCTISRPFDWFRSRLGCIALWYSQYSTCIVVRPRQPSSHILQSIPARQPVGVALLVKRVSGADGRD